MSDAKLRELSRDDPTGAPRLRELQRAGKLTEEKVLLMAFCGHPGACLLMQEEIEKETGSCAGWSNVPWIKKGEDPKWSSRFADHMENWSKALISLAPSRTTPIACKGPGGALGTAIRESTGPHPKICVCKGTGQTACGECGGSKIRLCGQPACDGEHPCRPCSGTGIGMREIGGIWLGVLALMAAAEVALPIWARTRRRACEGTGKRPRLNHYDNTPTGRFDKWPCSCCEKERGSIERAEIWLADPVDGNAPKTNPCGGDWGNATEAWGGIAPLIWERHGQEIYQLGRSMREFAKEFGEETIRTAVEKRVIEWALES